jgi:hypothetical protein
VSTQAVDEQLRWESANRVRAAIAAVLGALLTLGGGIYNGLTLRDAPTPLFVDSLRRVAEPGGIGSLPSLRLDQFRYYQTHDASILLGAVLLGLGALCAGGALTYLAFAVRHRAERFPRFGLYIAFVGGVLMLIGPILYAIGNHSLAETLLKGARTVDAVRDTTRPGTYYAGAIIQFIGTFALAAAYVLVGLNGMRVGLFTRFMGILGVIAGVFTVLPLIAGLGPVLQPLWLLMAGALILGYWPNGVPPAWRTGKAEPWPTAAQVREQRQAQQQRQGSAKGRREPPPAVEGTATQAPARPHPSSKKRKRKRRT